MTPGTGDDPEAAPPIIVVAPGPSQQYSGWPSESSTLFVTMLISPEEEEVNRQREP